MLLVSKDELKVDKQVTPVKMFWERYDQREILKMVYVTALGSLVDMFREKNSEEKEFKFEVMFSNLNEDFEIIVEVNEVNGKHINEIKEFRTEENNKTLNEIDEFKAELLSEIKILSEIMIINLMETSNTEVKRIIAEQKKSSNKTAKEIVELSLEELGLLMFNGLEEKLKNKIRLFDEVKKVEYEV